MQDAEAFGPIAERLGFQLRRADLHAMAALSEALSAFGVTPARGTAIGYIALHEGCDQMALGSALGINRASTMKAVNELVALGAVERGPGRDRRSNALYLTAAGRRLLQDIEAVMEENDLRLCGSLTATERQELFRLLRKVTESVAVPRPLSQKTRKPLLRSVP